MHKIISLILWIGVFGLFLFTTDRNIAKYNINNDMRGGGNYMAEQRYLESLKNAK